MGDKTKKAKGPSDGPTIIPASPDIVLKKKKVKAKKAEEPSDGPAITPTSPDIVLKTKKVKAKKIKATNPDNRETNTPKATEEPDTTPKKSKKEKKKDRKRKRHLDDDEPAEIGIVTAADVLKGDEDGEPFKKKKKKVIVDGEGKSPRRDSKGNVEGEVGKYRIVLKLERIDGDDAAAAGESVAGKKSKKVKEAGSLGDDEADEEARKRKAEKKAKKDKKKEKKEKKKKRHDDQDQEEDVVMADTKADESEPENDKKDKKKDKKLKKDKLKKKAKPVDTPEESSASEDQGDAAPAPPRIAATAPEPDLAERWNVHGLGGGASRQSKFMRLLGGGKKASAGSTETSGGQAGGRKRFDIGHVSQDLEKQFDAGIHMKFGAGGQRKGLGA
ncbi:hypothetical protein B0J18DRAFT_139772 [Chaetomium sp. MPI-SDFR-AT-0129]|nr:hypothetical protein B0J18DRAFT_139772 [Chaetomium sp. MPI-SDFR-AT-0129]